MMATDQSALRPYAHIEGLVVYKRRRPWGTYARHIVVFTCVATILFPILWVALLSIKSRRDSAKNYIWPNEFNFSHYKYVLTQSADIPQNLMNSAIVTIGTVVITTICANLAGYALVHLRMPGRKVILAL